MAFLDDIEKAIFGDINTTGVPRIQELLQFANESRNLSFHQEELDDEESNVCGRVFLILAYSIIIAISLFGNTLVCHVIFKNKRMRTVTNTFIANLAVSDLLLTCINVPFNIARNLIENWPFGSVMCHLMNFSLMVSSYVSTFTLLGIALDRQQVLMYPLSPRISKPIGIVVITIIWMVAIGLSLPFGLYNKVQTVDFFFKKVKRCTSDFPIPSDKWEKYLTITTFLLQFIIPLTVIGFTYGRIARKLWVRTHVGAVTQNQQVSQQKAKRKSIKMLMVVVVVFALCWMPLNLYQVLADFNPDHFSSTSFFICHWIAISSTCYNPFVYCWLNEAFREEVKSRFKCCFPKSKRVHPGVIIDGALIRSDRSYHKLISKTPSTNRRTSTSNRPNALYKLKTDIPTKEQSEDLIASPDTGNPVSDVSVSGATISGALETVLEFPELCITENIELCITENGNDFDLIPKGGHMSTGYC
ncbi:G-protein coupled receptor 83-like [Mya arenaria]|uniref:G-protein coupled receptor 83-like n=1 Tax=Mya arenaria TaxID=6604 RepID=UPI0022E5ADF9|nr:G-protein coupled receptor 83-like [Mya arenaria]